MPPQTSATTTKQGVPWSVKGVDLDTRDAAKEAARRAGMTLGEWLNVIIAESASEHDRRRAQRLKLETDREELENRLKTLARAEREEPASPSQASGPLAPMLERIVSESRFRNEALEQKTATALGALVNFIERSEQQRRQEVGSIASAQERTSTALRDALQLVSQRLDALERSVTSDRDGEFAPLRQAVGRLEARIADLGFREAAGQLTTPIQETLRDLEKRLVDMAARMGGSEPSASRLSGADAQRIERIESALGLLIERMGPVEGSEPRQPDPLILALREDVKGLAAKIEGLASDKRVEPSLAALGDNLAALARAVEGLPGHVDLGGVERELAELRRAVETGRGDADAVLSGRLDTILARLDRLDPERMSDHPAFSPLQKAIDEIRTRLSEPAAVDLSALDRRFDELAAGLASGRGTATDLSPVHASLSAIEDRIVASDPSPAMEKIQSRLEQLAASLFGREEAGESFSRLGAQVGRVLEAVEQAKPEPVDLSPLQRDLSALREHVLAAISPGSAPSSLDALQAQIASLAGSLQRTDQDLASIRSLERSVGELFERIEEARRTTLAAVEESARRAASEAAAHAVAGAARSAADVEPRDIETRQTLDAVQDTLENIVERLATLESDIAGDRIKLFEVAEKALAREAAPSAAPQPGPLQEPPAPRPSAAEKIAAAVAAAEAARSMMPARKTAGSRPPREDAAPATPDEAMFEPARPAAEATGPEEGAVAGEAASADFAASAADPDRPLEPGAGRPPLPSEPDLDEVDPRIDTSKSAFIAAARLAAQTSGRLRGSRPLDGKLPGESLPGSFGARAPSPSQRFRTFLDERRRPILLGLAAITFALGAVQLGRQYAEEHATEAPAKLDGQPKDNPSSSAIEGAGPATTQAEPDSSGKGSPMLAPRAAAPSSGFQAGTEGIQGTSGFTARQPGREPETVGAIGSPEPGAPAGAGADTGMPGLPKPLQKAAADGNPGASYELASRFFEGRGVARDTKLAAAWFERAAEAGFAPAQYRIGSMYEKGIGVAADPARAKQWYLRGAEQGNVKAMHNLGVILADGAGAKPDYAGAALWFRKAAEHGVRDSQYNLAILTARGLGLDRNLVQAWAWFALAASQGDEDAGRKRDEVGARLDPAALAAARAIVQAFRPQTPDPAANDVAAPAGGWDREQTGDASRSKSRSARL